MLQNLRSQITQYFDRQSLTSQLLLVFGLLLLLAYSAVDTPDIRLWVAVIYLVAGVGSLLLETFAKTQYTDQIIFITAGAAAAIGLVALPAEGVWTLWMGLIVFALIPTIPSLRRPMPLNTHLGYIAITVIGAMAGSIISENTEQFEDLWILGLGTLAVGHGILFNVRRLPASEVHAPREGQSEADARGVRLLAAQDLFDLSMRIHDTVDGLVRAAHAINDVTAQQTLSANEQTEFIETTNSKMDDFLQLAERITESAREITTTARESTEVSEDGKAALQQAMTGMEQIRMQVQAIGNNILMLAQLTRRIDEIITSVSEIATQSNLLALNASIEAARAGVHGRGFAVVADEVRSLSQQSTNAAHQVRDILAQIQNAVRQTVAATEAGVHGAEEGVARAKQADQVMMQLADNVNSTHKAVRLIYDGIREQADGLEEIAFSIERIERITQQSLASTRMVTTVSTNLNRLAEDLQEVVLMGQSTAAISMEEIDSSTLIPLPGDRPGQ